MQSDGNIYHGKDGRLRIYIKETGKTMSYPKYLMEKELGRELLPGEHVHHIDENPLNNEICNLKVMTSSDHAREHRTMYHDTVAICGWCGKEFVWTALQQQRFYSERRIGRHNSKLPFCSRECSGRYGRQLQVDNDSCGSKTRKLTNDQVRYIREHYSPYDKENGARALGRKFNVDKSVVEKIVQRQTYKEII